MIACAGELVVDCFVNGGKTSMRAGGAPLNVAAGIALLGGESAIYGAVGNDEEGRFMTSYVSGLPLCPSAIDVLEDRKTAKAVVSLENGERSFAFERSNSADYLLIEGRFAGILSQKTRICHFGSLILSHPEGRRFVEKAIGYCKKRKDCLISFDVNYREGIFKDEETARKTLLKTLGKADIVKVSEEELRFLTGMDDISKAAKSLVRANVLLLVSRGADGSYFRLGDMEGFVSATKVVTPVDTTGAGDAFLASVLFQLDGRRLEELRHEDIRSILERANACGALTTLKEGAIDAFPTPGELEGFLAS